MRLALTYRSVDPSKGGAETYVADLCRGLAERGHELSLFAERWVEGALPPDVRKVHVAARGRTRWGRTLDFARKAEAVLSRRHLEFDCTVGFINTWHQDILIPQGGVRPASLEHNAARFPKAWRPFHTLSKRLGPSERIYRAIERRQYDPSRGTLVVAVSHFVQSHLERFYGVPRERIRVIPNAIDAERLALEDPRHARLAFRERHGLEESDLVGLFLAHNPKLKGLDPLIEGLAERRRRRPDARPIHLLVGGRSKLRRYERLVHTLGLEDVVHLMGFQPDIRPAFHAADFFAMPSYYDPCSLVVFEALASGLPVITTAQNGAGEVLTPGRDGFVLAEPSDQDGLQTAFDQLAEDAKRRDMAEHARTLGRAQSFDRHLDRLEAVFGEVADRRRRVVSGGTPRVGSAVPVLQGGTSR